MKHNSIQAKTIAFVLTGFFIATNVLSPLPVLYAENDRGGSTVQKENLPHALSSIAIPQELGTVEMICPDKSGPLLLHIQCAHGDYGAEKNIQAILRHLTQSQNIDLLLLEGGIGKLNPGLFNFFPARPDLNLKVADTLLKKAELTGPELFLIENMAHPSSPKKIEAYGIEDAESYRKNRSDFQKVLTQRKQSRAFLNAMDLQMGRLAAHYLNPSLKNYFRELESYDGNKTDPSRVLDFLKREAQKNLEMDLNDPVYQRSWPMLVRYFRMKRIGAGMDAGKITEEKEAFLKKLISLRVDSVAIKQIQAALDFSGRSQANFSPSATDRSARRLFETLFEVLPENFSFKPYENLRLYIQSLILESELNSRIFSREVERLRTEISDKLTVTETEKKLISVLADYQMLKRLFALRLSREEYEDVFNRQSHDALSFSPSRIVKRSLDINKEKKVHDIEFTHLADLDRLCQLALDFYRGATGREDFMFRNILARLKRLGKERAILVTGGFHSAGIERYFESKNFSYVRISPRIDLFKENEDYVSAMLEAHKTAFVSSQIENVLKLQSIQEMSEQGSRPDYLRAQIAQAFLDSGVDAKQLSLADQKLLAGQYGLGIQHSRFFFLPFPPVANSSLSAVAASLGDDTPSNLPNPLNAPQPPRKIAPIPGKLPPLPPPLLPPLPPSLANLLANLPPLPPPPKNVPPANPSSSNGKRKTAYTHEVYSEFNVSHALKTAKLLELFGKNVKEVIFSPDDKYALVKYLSSNEGKIFDLESLQLINFPIDSSNKEIFFLKDRDLLFVASFEGSKLQETEFLGEYGYEKGSYEEKFYTAQVIDLKSAKVIVHQPRYQPFSAVFSKDYNYVVLRAANENGFDFNLYNLINGNVVKVPMGSSYPTKEVYFSSDNRYIKVSYSQVSDSYFSTETGTRVPLPNDSEPFESAYAPGKTEKSSSESGDEVIQEKARRDMKEFLKITDEDAYRYKFEISNDGRYAFVRHQKYDVKTKVTTETWKIINLFHKKEVKNPVTEAILYGLFSPDSKWLAVRFKNDGQILIHLETLEKVTAATAPLDYWIDIGETNPKFSSDGLLVALNPLEGRTETEAQVLQLKTRQSLSGFIGKNLAQAQFSDSSRYLAAKYKDNSFKVFDLEAYRNNPVFREWLKEWKGKFFLGLSILSVYVQHGIVKDSQSLLAFHLLLSSLIQQPSQETIKILKGAFTLVQKNVIAMPKNKEEAEKAIKMAQSRADGNSLGTPEDLLENLSSFNPRTSAPATLKQHSGSGFRFLTLEIMDGIEAPGNTASALKLSVFTQKKKDNLQNKAHDRDFGIVIIPVPRELNPRKLAMSLKDMRLVLEKYPNKLLVLMHPGYVPPETAKQLSENFDGRIFVFGGIENKIKFLEELFQGNFRKLDQSNSKISRIFWARALRMAKKTIKSLPSLWLLKYSLVVAPTEIFKTNFYFAQISKQFYEQSLDGVSGEDLFTAHILYGLALSSSRPFLLRDRIPDELDIDIRGGIYAIQLKPSFAREIADLVEAVRRHARHVSISA